MGEYRFESVIKSALTSKGVEFTIEPTSEYRKSITCGGRTVDVWFAVDEDEGVVPVRGANIHLSATDVSQMTSEVYTWFCTHAESGHAVTFVVDENGTLQYPKK